MSVSLDQPPTSILKLQNIKEGQATTKSKLHSLHGKIVIARLAKYTVVPDVICRKTERQRDKPMFSFVLP